MSEAEIREYEDRRKCWAGEYAPGPRVRLKRRFDVLDMMFEGGAEDDAEMWESIMNKDISVWETFETYGIDTEFEEDEDGEDN